MSMKINPHFVLQPLTQKHDVSRFSLGPLTSHEFYLKQAAWRYHEEGLAKTFVLTNPEESPTRVWGYITLTMSEIFINEHQLSTEILGTPQYESYPAAKIVKLAVDKKVQHKGLGRILLDWSINYLQLSIAPNIGCRYVVLDAAKDLIPFYQHSGFDLFHSDTNERDSFPLMFLDLYRMTG